MIYNLTDEMHTHQLFNFNQSIRQGVQTLWVGCFKLIMRKRKNVIGNRYGRLVVIKEVNPHVLISKKHRRKVVCKCDCGKSKTFLLENIRNGNTKSCGCLAKEVSAKTGKNSKTHGMTNSREHSTWRNMKTRCLNSNSASYERYGGRGITICKRWLKFKNFYEDMGNKPIGKTLDRIDNNKGYSKQNCRWATNKEQARNKKCNIVYKGEYPVEASKRLGGKRTLIYERIKRGWSIERAFNTPKK